jgi:DNA repair protein RadC
MKRSEAAGRRKADRIRNWPAQERPRERLVAEGAERLTDAELLAIVLRVGRGTFD